VQSQDIYWANHQGRIEINTVMKIYTTLFILVGICISHNVCFGQDKSGRDERAMLPDRFLNGPYLDLKPELRDKIVINNNTGREIIYTNRPVNKMAWFRQTLTFGYMHIYRLEEFVIKVETENREVSYILSSGNSYSIEWNARKRIWDVFRNP
jgi:hypothetical protein